MVAATRCGDGWLWYALGAILLTYGGPTRFAAVGAAVLAVGTGVGIFKILKRASRRPRPCQLEPHCWSAILPPDQFSFPSGHSITAFAVACCLGMFYPQLFDILMVAAVCIAASRDALAATGKFKRPIVTEIKPATQFWRAEEYHQQYLEKRGEAACHFPGSD